MSLTYKPNSRYAGIATRVYTAPDGREIAYSERRTPPRPETLRIHSIYRHTRDIRIDAVATQYFGDPEQYWRICDANLVFWPPDAVAEPLTELLIPLPYDGDGSDNA